MPAAQWRYPQCPYIHQQVYGTSVINNIRLLCLHPL
jgi:hypothetical protein